MTKCIFYLGIMFSSSACAQTGLPVDVTPQEALYPYRDASGKSGYADEYLYIRIAAQYKSASLFTGHGFAVITDSLDKKGVIGQNNKLIIARDYGAIQLHVLEDFTWAEVLKF